MKYDRFDPNLREEYKRLLMENEYGQIPMAPKKVYAEKIKCCHYLASKVIWTDWMLFAEFETGDTIMFPFRTYFRRNYDNTLVKNCKTLIHLDFAPMLPSKGSPTEEIVERGWNIVHVYYEDIVEDNGARNLHNDKVFEKLYPDTGKIMLWAWSMMRVFDVISQFEEVDEKNIGIVGHSRLGKTAFLTSAFDERFAFAHVNGSGTSGAAMFEFLPLDAKNPGESVKFITDYNPFWYCKKFKSFIGKEKDMPFDQHLLGYLVAPRILSIADGTMDYCASPPAEFECVKACSNAWEYYGKKGYIGPDKQVVDQGFYEGNVGYCYRTGIHYLGRSDWANMLDFFEKNLNK